MASCNRIKEYSKKTTNDQEKLDLIVHIKECDCCIKDILKDGLDISDVTAAVINDMESTDDYILETQNYKNRKTAGISRIANLIKEKETHQVKEEYQAGFFDKIKDFFRPNVRLTPAFITVMLLLVVGGYLFKNMSSIDYAGYKGEGTVIGSIKTKFSIIKSDLKTVEAGISGGEYKSNEYITFQYSIKEGGYISIFQVSEKGSVLLVLSAEKQKGIHTWQEDGITQGHELKGSIGKQVFVSVFSKNNLPVENIENKSQLDGLLKKESVAVDSFWITVTAQNE